MAEVRERNHRNELEKRNRELSVLNQIAEALNREADLQTAMQTASKLIVQLFDLETGWIFLLHEETDSFYVSATQNLPPALADHPRRMMGRCYCLDTFRDGDMAGAANINAIECSRLENLKEGTDGLRYHASIPLYMQEKQLGVLNVASTNWREISEDDLRLLRTVGDLMSMAIERAKLFQQSREIGALNERNRLAREIHDTIAQGLAALVLQLETADALLQTNTPTEKALAVIQKALEIARVNMEESRRSVMDLRAAPLEGQTLPEALRNLLNDRELKSSLQVELEIIGSGPPIPTRIAVELYRIAQEAISNVEKHANATRIEVQLRLDPERAQLIIKDNGRGFDITRIPAGHYGLIGLKERVRLLGGALNINSANRAGTTIHTTIPLENER